MTCPRCKGLLHSAQDEMRVVQGDVIELQAAECIKCANCGHRIYPQIMPALPMHPEMKLPKQEYMAGIKPGRKPAHRPMIEKYYDSIKEMRKGRNCTGWDAISRLITTAEGVPIKGETVRKYYEEIAQSRKGRRAAA